MPTVYGVANHTPDQTFLWLQEEFNVQSKDVTIVPIGAKIPPKKKNKIRRILFFLTSSDYNANCRQLEEYKENLVFLFSSPLRLWEYKNIIALDYKESKDPQRHGLQLFDFFDLKTLNNPQQPLVKEPNRDYLTYILSEVRSYGSLLRPFMTFVYTLPNSTHQGPVKVAICQWLFYGGNKKDLEDILGTIDQQIKLTEKHKFRMRDLLLSEQGDKYRAAFAKLRKLQTTDKSVSYEQLSKDFEVSAFEMRYIKSIIDKEEKNTDHNVTIHDIVNRMLKRKSDVEPLKQETSVKSSNPEVKGKPKVKDNVIEIGQAREKHVKKKQTKDKKVKNVVTKTTKASALKHKKKRV